MNKKSGIIIIGADGGMGMNIAQQLAQNGFENLFLGSLDISKLRKCAKGISHTYGIKPEIKKVDIRIKKEVDSLIDTAICKYKEISTLINCAGVSIHGEFQEISEDDWDEVLDTNLKGVFLCSNKIWRYFLEKGKGHILTISSGSGEAGYPNGSIYCASKFGVNGLMESLRKEGQEKNIKVTNICPGQVNTKIWPNDKIINKHRKNMLKAKDIAQLVAYIMLADDNVHFQNISIHPFLLQPDFKGRNRGPRSRYFKLER